MNLVFAVAVDRLRTHSLDPSWFNSSGICDVTGLVTISPLSRWLFGLRALLCSNLKFVSGSFCFLFLFFWGKGGGL